MVFSLLLAARPDTLRSVALAWLLTLPASLFLGAVPFLASRALLG